MAGDAPYAFDDLDPLIHERARLGILTSLAPRRDGVAFTELKRLCRLTDGNLSRHVGALQEAGLISVEKAFQDKRPLTTCRITTEGLRRFADYIAALERVVRDGVAATNGSLPAPATR